MISTDSEDHGKAELGGLKALRSDPEKKLLASGSRLPRWVPPIVEAIVLYPAHQFQ